MVRFYHIIAFFERANPTLPQGGCYLGKTSDLVFKVDPDKSLDLDDGTTEVGSEKLSLSCSLLGELQNQPEIKEIWLIPVDDNYIMHMPEIIRLYLETGDYKLDAKSGEFNKIIFTATLRYPVDNPQWEPQGYWGSGTAHIVIGVLSGDIDGGTICLNDEYSTMAEININDLIIKGAYAFTGIIESGMEITINCGEVLFSDYPQQLGGLKVINATL
jgi:hypothetical protein